MKILEQTSTHLILKDSVKSAWGIRLFCTPFFLFGCLGLVLVIIEKIFPSFFIIFCLLFGIFGIFFSAVTTVILDKNKNKISIKVQRLFRKKEREYSLNEVSVRVHKTPWKVKDYSSFLIVKKESIYVVILEIASISKQIKFSGNYSFTQNEAVKIANIIRTFLNQSR
ncbi:hypothetical protein M595_3960 [Lyngbya aestuarii BL J]|uniref:Uncharacterized protein n=1 Tax=Lyngbya aestuarii BL J TaxID=1348334 RepID=U7QDZ2_9CYAN|nr:hypothetical protein [Lyngbya aestuarii]ERT06078.1 hypothetical protein M595_3960 [Lyngbya aestuarii BL J]